MKAPRPRGRRPGTGTQPGRAEAPAAAPAAAPKATRAPATKVRTEPGEAGAGATGASAVPTPAGMVSLGVIVRAHGLQGEVRVKAWNEDSRLLATLARATLLAKDGAARVVGLAARKVAEGWLAKLDGVSDKDAADALRGNEIAVARDLLPPIDPDEVYLVDLVGLEVWDGAKRLGVVDAIFEYPSVDCLQVTGDDGVRELPMLDAYLVRVDRDSGRIEAARTDELPVEPKRVKTER